MGCDKRHEPAKHALHWNCAGRTWHLVLLQGSCKAQSGIVRTAEALRWMLSGSAELLAGSMPLADRDMLPDDCRGSQSAWVCRPVDARQSSWVKIQEESTSHPEKGSHAYACQQAVRV